MKNLPSSETIKEFIVNILTIITIFGLTAIPLKILWNWLLPNIFGIPEIIYTESLGILFFIYFLFPFGRKK
jgi:hypothetical protein